MSKIKTRRSIRKRFRITGRKKLMRRAAGQDHFNARDTGKRTKRKRRDVELHASDQRAVRRMINV